jgi:protein TonB
LINISYNQTWPQSNESETQYFLFAVAISVAMHFVVMQLIPLMDKFEPKPPLTIVAEMLTLAPPPPPPPAPMQESNPVEETPVKQIEKQVQKEPKPITEKPDPILTSKSAEAPSDYVVPDTPRAEEINKTPSAPVAPVAEPTESTSSELSATSSSTSITNTISSNWSDSDLWDEYGNNLQRLCERNKKYPEIARRRNLQGMVKVAIQFSAEGKPLNIAVESSSGHASLDDQAIEMVKKSIKELPLPNKFRGKNFKITIPIDFKLES